MSDVDKTQLNQIIQEELLENSKFYPEAKEAIEKNDSSSIEDRMAVLATLRNRKLITKEQQTTLQNTCVAFIGLSVGSHAALTWSMLSRCKTIKISDPDTISPTNLNRLRFGWDSVGKTKVEVVTAELLNMLPTTNVQSLISKDIDSLEELLQASPKVDMIVDANDDITAKIALRKFAQKYKIPVLMITDVGDNVFIDVERYDQDPNLKLFNGLVEGIENYVLAKLGPNELRRIAMQVVGLAHNSLEMLQSLSSIGKDIATWPQLGSTATIAGGVTTTAIKKIILQQEVASGRYIIDLDELLTPQLVQNQAAERENLISNFFK